MAYQAALEVLRESSNVGTGGAIIKCRCLSFANHSTQQYNHGNAETIPATVCSTNDAPGIAMRSCQCGGGGCSNSIESWQ